eukprot:7385288-Prymnesium_polylepis.1
MGSAEPLRRRSAVRSVEQADASAGLLAATIDPSKGHLGVTLAEHARGPGARVSVCHPADLLAKVRFIALTFCSSRVHQYTDLSAGRPASAAEISSLQSIRSRSTTRERRSNACAL